MHKIVQMIMNERAALEDTMKDIGWKVIKDPINTDHNDPSIVGRELSNYKGGKNRIRLRDGDGTVYFYLYSDIDYNSNTEYDADVLFYPADTLGRSYGCTDLEYKTPTGEYVPL